MEDKTLGVFVPSAEEKKITFKDYISRIYAILVTYEATKRINKEYVNLLCFEMQSYGHLTGDDELAVVTGKLITLTADGVDHAYVRKIVLDTTNYLTRVSK